MSLDRSFVPAALLATAALIAVAAGVAAVVTILGTGDGGTDAATAQEDADETNPSTAQRPSSEPTEGGGEPERVRGEVTRRRVTDLSIAGNKVVQAGSGDDQPVAVDEAAVDAFVEVVVETLDGHLDDLQEGGEGTLGRNLRGPKRALELTGPDAVVEEADYRLRIGARREPEWVETVVTVDRADDSRRRVTLVFVPRQGEARLLGAQRGAP